MNTLAIANEYTMKPISNFDSWSNFIRTGSGRAAASVISAVPKGGFVEVWDSKFDGESLILLRRTDFDNMNMLSSLASRAKRCLVLIEQMTSTVSSGQESHVIDMVRSSVSLGFDSPTTLSTSSFDDYNVNESDSDKYDKMNLPPIRKNRKLRKK